MPLSMVATVSRIRELVEEITGLERVYAASETDENAIPLALNEFPCAVVYPGNTLDYSLSSGGQRHTYEVHVLFFEAGMDLGERAAGIMPMVDLLIQKFEANVAMGGVANRVLFRRQNGLSTLDFGGGSYTGYDCLLEVSEQAIAAPAAGVSI